jgi:hypothetical protein
MKNKYWNNPQSKFPLNNKGGWFIPLIVAAVSAAASAGISGAIGASQQKSAEENAQKQQATATNQAYQSATKDGILNYSLARTDITSPEYQLIFNQSLSKGSKSGTVASLWSFAKNKIAEYEKRTALTPEQIAANEEAYQAQYDQLVAALKPGVAETPQTIQPQIFSQGTADITGYLPLVIGGVIAIALIMRRK